MELHPDFTQRATAHAAQLDWTPSPMQGVDRRMLERLGDEVARATSIVRYAEGSAFSPHKHPGGEEFIVLDGVFQDEHADYPPGSYVRNPPGTGHTPRSEPGCVIFVKLWQFDAADDVPVVTDLNALETAPDPTRPGVSQALLFENPYETVRLERWAPGAKAKIGHEGGAEYFVLKGGFEEAGEAFVQHDWLRTPQGYTGEIEAGPQGTELWVKTGHLPHVRIPKAS